MINFLFLWLFFCTFFSHVSGTLIDTLACEQQMVEGKELVEKLLRHHMASLAWDEEDWPHEKFYDFLHRTYRYQDTMQAIKKRRLAFTILKSYGGVILQDTMSQTDAVLDDQVTWNDLNLFKGAQDPTTYFAQKVDYTTTEMGKATLLLLLTQPVVASDVIKKRQSIIRELLNNQALFADLEQDLLKLKSTENMLFSFWGNDPFKQALDRHYFHVPIEALNDLLNSEMPLLINAIYEHQKSIGWSLASGLATMVLPIYGLLHVIGKQAASGSLFNRVSERLIGTGNPALAFLSLINHWTVQTAIGGFGGFYAGLSAANDYRWMRDNFVAFQLVQEKLIKVATFISTLKELLSKINKHTFLKTYLASENLLCSFQENHSDLSSQLEELTQLLQTPTFQGEAALLSHQGRILRAYKRLHELKHALEAPLCALGEIDAYVSMAKLYKEHADKNARYCFVELKATERPFLEVKGFWNPFIDPTSVVKNSFSLAAEDSPEHIAIVTGPNAGGKSTFIKGLVLNLILAQVFGLAAADVFMFAPFSFIATYLNVTDDIAAGNSLFKAQVLRVEELLARARLLNKSSFWFIAFDEVFTGTAAKEGQALSYSLAKDLATYLNNICIIATHFPLLVQLEAVNKAFVNYKVSAHIDDQGRIHYPFTVEHGASSQNIAIDILRAEGFKSDILEEASALVQNSN